MKWEGGRMKSKLRRLALGSSQAAERRSRPSGREFQELWFALARKDWRSVVLVPADAGESAAAAATSLAEVGRQLHELPVTLFVMANPLDYWPALQMVTTAASTDEGTLTRPTIENALDYASAVQLVASAASTGQSSVRPAVGQSIVRSTAGQCIVQPAAGKVIIAVQPVVVEPLGLAVTQAADVAILCIEMGRTHLASARRTIDLVGRKRIAGCLLMS